MKNWLRVVCISFMLMFISYTSVFAMTDEFNAFRTPNAPVLYGDMKPIKWDGGNEVEINSDDLDWYNYSNKKWANAKDGNGNYWVWIPRYTYRIIDGKIEIVWSSGTEDFINYNYMIHPAFIADAYTGGDPNELGNYKNGNGKEELTGFWVAKYMVSDNDSEKHIMSNRQPDVNKNIGEAFNYCLNLENKLGVSTHLIKASEWGAVSYLTEAFGVVPTENSTVLTGGNNSNSTTNNIYGVFDMNGPVGEYLASFVMKDTLNSGVIEYAGNMIYEEYENFVDIVNLTENDNVDNNDKRLENFYGIAMSETKNFVSTDYENVPTGSEPFFSKGGSNVGMFGYDRTNGTGLGYRPTLSVYSSYLSEDIAFFDTEASVVAGDYLVVSVNFSVDKDWKFDLDEGEKIIENGKVVSGKETRIFDFIDLRYSQNNKSMTLTNGNLNEHLIGIIEEDKTLEKLDAETKFKADTQYTVRVRIGGCNDENVPVFLAIPGMTSKIIVNNIDVVSVDDGTNLKVSSIFNNKVRLSIYDSQGRIPVLTGVKLITAPDKKDYYKGERLSLVGGTLEISYGDNKAIVELTKDNVVNYETVTDTEGENQLVELIYGGVEVVQDDVEFRINVSGNQKFDVSGESNPKNSAVIISGLGQHSEEEQVNLKANVYPGYKFSSWSSSDVDIQSKKSVDEAYFIMPKKDVKVIVNTIRATSLEVINPKTEFERGDAFELGDGKIIAHYPDGSSEELTLNSPGVTSNPGKNEILDELGEKNVSIEYGGAETNYNINVVKEKYNLTLYIDSIESGSIKIGENVILPVNDKITTILSVSYDDVVKVKAEPNDGYAFYGWYVSDKGFISDEYLSVDEISFIMPQQNLLLKASFVKAHTLTYKVEDENTGSISGKTEQIIKHGENAEEVTAVAKDGYKFKEWIEDGRTEADRLDQYVVADATYTAKFVKTYNIQYLVDGVTFATRIVEYGASGYISEIPEKKGFVFEKWVDKDGNDAKLDSVVSDMIVYAKLLPWIEFNPNGSIEAKDVVETIITGRNVKEGTFEYIISESKTETGENISDYVSNDTFIFNGSWKTDESNKELYRSYIAKAKEDSSTTITIVSNNDKELVKFDYMFAVGVKDDQLLGITVNGTRVTEYDEETNVWHSFNREVNTVDGKIVIGISYSQDANYAVSDYAAIRNLKIGRQWTKISSIYNLKDNAIWSENYVHVRGVFTYDDKEILYQVVSEPFKGDNDNQGELENE